MIDKQKEETAQPEPVELDEDKVEEVSGGLKKTIYDAPPFKFE